MFTALIGLLILVLDLIVIYRIVVGRTDPGMKLVWIILVLLLPFLGPILYLVIAESK